MTTPAANALPTDNPHTVAVDPSSIQPLTPEALLSRVHARLSAVEATMASTAHRVESAVAALLKDLAPLAERVANLGANAAALLPAGAAKVVAAVEAVAGAICACGHDALHTTGGCTEPGCTCATPPKK